MKKLTVATGALMVCAGAFAQGTLTFQNAAPNLVTITPAGQASETATKTGGTAPNTGIEVALYYQIDSGGSAPSAIGSGGTLGNWQLGAVTPLIPVAGDFNGGTLALSGTSASGQTVWIDVVGWNNGSTTEAAALGAGGTASYFGSSTVFSLALGAPQGSPPTTPASIEPSFTGLNLQPIPEPTTLVLGGLGAASLLFLRRRK